MTIRSSVVTSDANQLGYCGDGTQVAQGPGRPVDDLDVLRPQGLDQLRDDPRIVALLEPIEDRPAHLVFGLGQDHVHQGSARFLAVDPSQHVGQEPAHRDLILAKHFHEWKYRRGLLDLHQLALGLSPAIRRSGDDRLPEYLDPSHPGRLCGAGLCRLLALRLVFLGDPLSPELDQSLKLAEVVGREPLAAVLNVAELLVGRLEAAITSEGRLVVDLRQVGELVLFAPEPSANSLSAVGARLCFLSR